MRQLVLFTILLCSGLLYAADFIALPGFSGFTRDREINIDYWALYKPATAEDMRPCRTDPGMGGSMNSGLTIEGQRNDDK